MNNCASTAGYYPHEAGVTEIDAPDPTVPAEPAPETLRVPAPPDGSDPPLHRRLADLLDDDWFDY